MHEIRSMEMHLQNTWQFDKWGFTQGMNDLITMTDIDGLYGYFFETGYKYLFVEMKHWDGLGEIPHINRRSGQAVALRHLSTEKNFNVLIGYGDTSTQQVHYAEVWNNGSVHPVDFKEALYLWWAYYHVKG
jgi:hypothetical protein